MRVCTTKTRGEIMRTNNRVWKRRIINIAKLALLAICFSMVFCFALADEFFGIAFAADYSAYRVYDSSSSGSSTYTYAGTSAGGLYGDHGALDEDELKDTLLSFGTYTETFNTVEASKTNFQVYKNGTSSAKLGANYGVGFKDAFYCCLDSASSTSYVVGVINYQLSDYLLTLLSSGSSIDVTYTATFDKSGTSLLFGMKATSSALSASGAYSVLTGSTGMMWTRSSAGTYTTDSSLTVSSGSKYISIVFGIKRTSGTGLTEVLMTDLNLHMTVYNGYCGSSTTETYGTSNAIYGDSYTAFTDEELQTALTSQGECISTFNYIRPTTSNFEIYKNAQASTVIMMNSAVKGVYVAAAKVTDSSLISGSGQVHSTLNYKMSTSDPLYSYIVSDRYSVTAYFSFEILEKAGNNFFYRAVASADNYVSGSESYSLRSSNSSTFSESSTYTSGSTLTTSAVELTSSTPYVAFALGVGWGNNENNIFRVVVQNVQLHVSVSMSYEYLRTEDSSSSSTNGAYTYANTSAGAIYGDSGELTKDNMFEAVASLNTYKETFTTIEADKANFQVYKSATASTLFANYNIGVSGIFYCGISSGSSGSAYVVGVINYQVSDYVRSLISSGYTVTAGFGAYFNKSNGTLKFGIAQGTSLWSGADAYSLLSGGSSNGAMYTRSDAGTYETGEAVTLTSSTKYISIMFGVVRGSNSNMSEVYVNALHLDLTVSRDLSDFKTTDSSSSSTSGPYVYGEAGAIYGDSGELTSTMLGIDNVEEKLDKYGNYKTEYVETFATITPTTDTFEVYKPETNATLSMNTTVAGAFYVGATVNSYGLTWGASQAHGVINYKLSTDLAKLLRDENYTIRAYFTAYCVEKSGNGLFFSAVAGASELQGSVSYCLRENATFADYHPEGSDDSRDDYSFGYSTNTSPVGTTIQTNSVTLSQAKSNLAFAFGVGWNNNSGGDKLALLSNLQLHIVIIYGEDIDENGYAVADNYDGAYAFGTAGSISGDSGELTGIEFAYPGTSGATTWTYTETFKNFLGAVNKVSTYKDGGNGKLYIAVSPDHFFTGILQVGVLNVSGAAQVHGVINIALGDFLLDMIRNDNIVVTAYITGLADKMGGNLFYSAIASEYAINAETSYTLRTSGDSAYSYSYQQVSDCPYSFTTNTVTLTADQPNLAFAFGVGWGIGSYDECMAQIDGLKVVYTITMLSSGDSGYVEDSSTDSDGNYDMYFDDGAAPQAATKVYADTSYVKETSGTGYAPYLTDYSANNSDDWPVYYNSLASSGLFEIDNVKNGNGTLASYASSLLSGYASSCYKYAQIEYVDMYNFSGYSTLDAALAAYASAEDASALLSGLKNTIGAGDRYLSSINSDGTLSWTTGNAKYASGIKTVVIGNVTWNVSKSGFAKETKTIYDTDGNEIGRAVVQKTNRARIIVSLYMTANAVVDTEVTDFGGLSTITSLEFSGIDTQAPTSGVTFDRADDNYDFVATDATTQELVEWYRNNSLALSTDNSVEDEVEGIAMSPYVWFYTVKKSTQSFADIPSATAYSSYSAIKSAGLQPIAAGSFVRFEYDFENGIALTELGNVAGGATGAGYYCFTFYTCDLAGNIRSEASSYYFKVDYITPSYTLTYNDGEITPASGDDVTWSHKDATITIAVDSLNLSGNMLLFADYDGNEHEIVFDGTSIISINGVAVNAASSDSVLNAIGIVNDRYVKISVSASGSGAVITLVFSDSVDVDGVDTVQMFALDTAFMLYGGEEVTDLVYVDPNWEDSGVSIYVDAGAPDIALLENEEEEYIKALATLDSSSIAQDKLWYTVRNGILSALLNFYDEASETDFGNQVIVYYGMKKIAVGADGDFGEDSDIIAQFLENYASISASTYSSYFDTMGTISGDALSSDGTSISIDLRSNLDAGLRVLYVWAVDQAGNMSAEVSKYYVLYDSNTYAISAQLKENTVLGNTASIVAQNEDGDVITSATRGQKIYLNIEFEEGYVPYSLDLILNGKHRLLENMTQSSVWTSTAPSFVIMDEASVDAPIGFTLDHATNLNKLETGNDYNTVGFLLAHRKVIEYTPTLMVLYNGTQTVVPMTYNDDRAADHMVYQFADSNGNLLSSTPSVPGTYKVNITIADSDTSFVAYDRVGEGEEAIWLEYIITKGQAIITAIATTSNYGDEVILDYEISGTTKEYLAQSGAVIALALNVAGVDDYSKLNAGTYQIVSVSTGVSQDENELYDISFVSNYHTVAKRAITITVNGATKVYGELDPSFSFSVDTTQFASGQAYTDLFSESEFGTPSVADTILTFATLDKISRTSGENVGEYQFATDASQFDINDNYRVVIKTEGQFVITQRTIIVDASGQFVVKQISAQFDKDNDYTSIVPSYVLSASDTKYANEISGSLALESLYSETGTTADYHATYVYVIGIGTLAGNGNVKVELSTVNDANKFIVYIALAGTASISLKEGVTFGAVYGYSAFEIPFDEDSFVVSIDDDTVFTTVKWTASVTAGLGAGTYSVSVSGATLYNGDEALTNKVVIEPFNVTISPATIIVAPIATTLQKTYGEADSVYGIGWQVVSINGISDLSAGYADTSLDTINGYISGTFARACYDESGNFKYFGSRTDDVTVDNLVYGTTNYYGYAVNGTFASSNVNYQVEPQIDADARFVINKAALTIEKSDFVGTHKYYDGTTIVTYTNGTSPVEFTQEGVELSYTAVYDSATIGERSITFTNLGLTGERAYNYELVVDFDSVTISVIKPDGEKIQIYAGYIDVNQANFTIQKEYDKTTTISKDNVTLGETTGSNILVAVANAGNVTVESGAYSGIEVSDNYSITTLTLFYAIDGIDSVDFSKQGVYSNIIVEKVVGEVSGVRVTLTNQKASIVKRVLDASSFENMDAVDREYNAKDTVSYTYTFADGALVAGDSAQTLNLTLSGKTVNGEKDFGSNYAVEFVGYNEDTIDSHYTVDIASLNNKYKGNNQLYVDIQRAKLMPNVSFADKEYDGTSSVIVSDNSSLGVNIPQLTTLRYAEELNSELMCFSYSLDTTSFALSKDGKENGNIVTDDEGNVILHNVMVSGLVVSESGSNNYLKNYELYGARYVGSEYVSLGTIVSGQEIAAYELIGAANITRREVVINTNDVTINDKVYDGTRDAEVSILLENNAYIIESDRAMLKVNAQATFARKQVGDNIAVEISGVELDVIDEAYAYVLNNYTLKDYALSGVQRSIKQRAIVASEISLGDDKVYDGDAKVESSSVNYTFEGMLEEDVASYRVSLANGGAYFVDKNVAVDDEGNVIEKSGNIFNPLLRNLKGNMYINYVLAIKGDYVAGEQYYAYEFDGSVVYTYDTKEVEGADCYYYPLEQTTKYILNVATSADQIQAAKDAGALIGAYYYNGDSVYLVKESYAGTISGAMTSAVTYIEGAVGVIQQRQISVASVQKVSDTAFTKTFDGTTKFYGENGTDYVYDTTNIINMIKGDDVTITGVSAAFDSANTNAGRVLFSATGIAGADASNYKYNEIATTALSASITPLTVVATLGDSTIEYGKLSSQVVGDISYTLGGYELIVFDGSAYMKSVEFLKHVGFYNENGELVDEDDADLVSALTATLYSLVDGELIEDASGEYIKLAGTISTLPYAKASFPQRAAAGSTYALTLNTGYAQNLNFVAEYTEDESSTLTITKKSLYIAIQIGDYQKVYGTANSTVGTIGLIYMDAQGNVAGIVSGDTPQTVFGSNVPQVAFGLYDASTNTITEIDLYAKISDDLAPGQFYVAYIVVSDSFEPVNYTVVLGDLVVDGETLKYEYDGTTLSAIAPQLSIVLPTITNVSISQTEASTTYNRESQTASLVSGEKTGDRVYFVIDGQKVDAKDVDVYEGKILVERDVKVDENDTNGYVITWESADSVKLTINKAKPGLSAQGINVGYDAQVHEYDISLIKVSEAGKVDGFSYTENDITVVYKKLVDGSYVEVDASEVKNYGTYRVTICLASTNDNYMDETVSAYIIITKAVVEVTITTTQLSAIYQEGNSYAVDYTIGENSMGVTKADTEIKYFRGDNETQIAGAGRYQFRVVLKGDLAALSENYNLVGGTGNYDLTINSINSYDKQEEVIANVTLNDNETMIADTLEVRYVYETNALSADTLYYASVNQFMSSISESAGVDATLHTVVRMSLQYGDNKIALDGKESTISIKLTDDILDKLDQMAVYQVSQEGTLVRLENYQVSEDTLSYTTDYLGSIVFVRLGSDGAPAWVSYAVAGGIAGVVLVVGIVLGSIIAKRRKFKKALDLLDD